MRKIYSNIKDNAIYLHATGQPIIDNLDTCIEENDTPQSKQLRQALFPKWADKYTDIPAHEKIEKEFLIFSNGGLEGLVWKVKHQTKLKLYIWKQSNPYKTNLGIEAIKLAANY
tara:strand:+ start:188 stop:529 length:342 start_codon:yes stop_codon:yes gene_type:complete